MTEPINGTCIHPATREEPADGLGLVPVVCRMCGKLVGYRNSKQRQDARKRKAKAKR